MASRYEKISFTQFEDMVRAHDRTLSDVVTPFPEIEFRADTGGTITAREKTLFGAFPMTAHLNDNAWMQLCSRLDVPHRWLHHKAPADLQETVVKRLQQEHPENMLVRFRGRDDDRIARALLTEHYLVYNHLSFWNDISYAITGSALDQLKPMVWKPQVGDSMNAWILFDGAVTPSTTGESPRLYDGGDLGGLKPAIHIRNSEDGTGRVRVASGFFRSYCTNGVIFGFQAEDSLAAVHRGSDQSVLGSRVIYAVAQAAANCGIAVKRFTEAVNQRIKDNVISDVVKTWSKQFAFTVDAWQGLDGYMNSYPMRTWADVVMATSDYAGRQDDITVQVGMEEMAGAMLAQGARPAWRQ